MLNIFGQKSLLFGQKLLPCTRKISLFTWACSSISNERVHNVKKASHVLRQ